MKELAAVNMLLRLIGSSPVNSLQSPHPDVSNAIATLRRVSEQLQQQGWWFNLDYAVTMTPDTNNEIVFSNSIIGAKTGDVSLIKRGSKLYDRANQTSKFYNCITLERVTRLLDWDDMPPAMQTYCSYFAAAEFIRDELEDPTKQDELNKSAAQALITLNAQDLDEGNYNMFDKSRVRKARYGVRPYGLGVH